MANAQLCNGSLGDPAVNITFPATGPSSYVPANNSYIHIPTDCPNDGYYTVIGNTSNCFGNTWHTVISDHTNKDNFMLVNASFAPGVFFVDTVKDLCPNTTYEFAAWVMNVMKPLNSILPNLTFSIETPDGALLNSIDSGEIPVTGSPQWKQYGLFFSTPLNNPVIVLRITNHAPGGYGNDLALDDITFRPCGSKITASIDGANSDTINVCEGYRNTYTFNADVSSGYVSPVFQWQESTDKGQTWNNIPGATGLSYTRTPLSIAGNYWYRFTVVESSVANISSCRIASTPVVLNVHTTPVVSAGPDRIMLTGDSIVLAGEATGEQLTYWWQPDAYINSIDDLAPTVSPPAEMIYTLSAESPYGCAAADSMKVKVVTGIYVPTAFTPNGDGKNDRWEIPYLDPSFGGTVNVFNRWGQLVYHISSGIVSWDGKINGIPQAAGTYVYMISFKTNDLFLKGTITLIR